MLYSIHIRTKTQKRRPKAANSVRILNTARILALSTIQDLRVSKTGLVGVTLDWMDGRLDGQSTYNIRKPITFYSPESDCQAEVCESLTPASEKVGGLMYKTSMLNPSRALKKEIYTGDPIILVGALKWSLGDEKTLSHFTRKLEVGTEFTARRGSEVLLTKQLFSQLW